MRVLEAFETSEKLTREGLTCEIEFGGEVIAVVQVRPADVSLNPDYRRELANLAVDLKADGDISDTEDARRLWKLYFRTVVISIEWTDPADKKDPKLKFNEKNWLALCTRAPKFFQAIQRVALRWAGFRAAYEADATGN